MNRESRKNIRSHPVQIIKIYPAHDNTCTEHGNRGPFPCAWPDCPNGLHDDEFEQAPIIQGEEHRCYKRRKWHSPLGSDYYSWESNALPNWFSAQQTFWNEVRRHKLIPDTFPKVVYHYTSLEGFMGIVNSRAVWMTEFSYLNDRREVSYGLELLLDTIRHLAETEQDDDVRGLLSAWSERLAGAPNRVCITSFSADSDSLSQWRAYGPIAVGFPVHPLALHVNQARLQPVEYNPEAQKKLVTIYVHHLMAAFTADLKCGRLTRSPDIYHKSDRLLELAVFFKDPAFRTENEYRLVYIDYPEVLESLELSSPPKSFRTSKGKIIPYVPSTNVLLSEHRNFELKISEVILGPESDDLLDRGVREFLNENGLSGVEVRRSVVPLRP